MAFTPEIELAALDIQQNFQVNKLKELLKYVSQKSPFYQKKFCNDQNYEIDSIKSLKDLTQFPTTTKVDLQLYLQDFLCVPKSKIAEYTSTSGTLGSPVTIALTQNDIQRLAYNEYLSFELMELTKDDIVQLMLTLDRQFMAGIAYYLGVVKNGAACIRTGPGLPSMQIECMQRLSSTALVAVPSFLIKLISIAESENISVNTLPIKKALCIGENIRNAAFELNTLGTQISKHWGLKLFSSYASTEMQTAFTECSQGKGGHAHPELIILEIIDEKGNQLKAGEYGEVCISTLGVEAMPLFRYRTGDICCYYNEPCICGRKTIRLSPVLGRKKQMIKYKGTTLYPQAIFDILNQCNFINEYVVEVRINELETDDIILHISSPLSSDACESKLRPFFKSQLRVIPFINFLSHTEIHEMQHRNGARKAIKFIDNRNLNIEL